MSFNFGVIGNINGDEVCSLEEVSVVCPFTKLLLYAPVCGCVWVCSVVSDSLQPHGLWPTRLLCPWDFQARILELAVVSYSRGSS